jgi:hypothetical protein
MSLKNLLNTLRRKCTVIPDCHMKKEDSTMLETVQAQTAITRITV